MKCSEETQTLNKNAQTQQVILEVPYNVVPANREEDERRLQFKLYPNVRSVLVSQEISGYSCQKSSAVPPQAVIIICRIKLSQALHYERTAWKHSNLR